METRNIFKFVFVIFFTGSIMLSAIKVSGNVDELPPEPKEPAAVKVSVEELEVPEGKEVILDIYTVKKGDYLVKIAGREYDNPEIWKLIHSYNQYIKEPHWIFPGDKLIIPKIVDKLPEIVEEAVAEEPEEEKIEKPRKFSDFVAPPDFSFSGTITGFKVNKLLHGQSDYVFIDIGVADGVTEGLRLNVFRRGRVVSHPYTGQTLGTVVEKLGCILVTGDVEDYTSTAKILYSHQSLNKGDMLLLSEENEK
ncbi:LysM peptidoglycan-binding domain-containing protein [Elusimicrobiota bacterium]